MWSVVDRLLGRGHRSCDSVSADDLFRFFADKVEQIRSTTSSSTPPTAEKDVNSCQVHSTVRDWLLTVAHYDFVEVSPLAQ